MGKSNTSTRFLYVLARELQTSWLKILQIVTE
jgi:hypothetical protein